jgi:hypothetical protein
VPNLRLQQRFYCGFYSSGALGRTAPYFIHIDFSNNIICFNFKGAKSCKKDFSTIFVGINCLSKRPCIPTKFRELLVYRHGVTFRKTSIIILNAAVKLESCLLICFIVCTFCILTRTYYSVLHLKLVTRKYYLLLLYSCLTCLMLRLYCQGEYFLPVLERILTEFNVHGSVHRHNILI